MSFLKASQDELLDGFCRGCLNKYEDPADLLHYTEKNRRLFVYSTGIQVKLNDTFTFQICKHCYANMKISCKFKKQCRSSDRRFKSFLRLKEVGDNTDLVTFLKNSEDILKFPLSGNSTPANHKREDDNVSTCTSIRNFMTEILQGEEMADTEARIIKEVIEEEADLLEDSLDSHWLQDDSVDNDFRLDFSFSPYVTPRSVDNDTFTPIKQIEPSLRCKNNHTKKVLLQLPTSQCSNDDNVVSETDKPSLQNYSFKQKTPSDLCNITEKDDDSITKFITAHEEFLITNVTTEKEKSIDAFENKTNEKPVHSAVDNESVNHLDLASFDSSQVDGNRLPLTENDLAVQSITSQSFHTHTGKTRYKLPSPECDVADNNIHQNTLNSESHLSKDIYNLIETNKAVQSIMINDIEMKIGRDENKDMSPIAKSGSAVKIINVKDPFVKPEHTIIAPINISDIAEQKSENELSTAETDQAVESIRINGFRSPEENKTNNLYPVTNINISDESTGFNAFQTVTQLDGKINVDLKMTADNSVVTCSPFYTDKLQNKDDNEDSVVIDTIDKNLEEALKNHANKDFSLDVLLVSPTEVLKSDRGISTPSPGVTTRMSTPTINNILFGEKLEDKNDIDPVEEFFRESVKDFENANLTAAIELPLELKYDFQNCHCKMCNRTFGSKKALKGHLAKVHRIRFPKEKIKAKPTVCTYCGKYLTDARNLSHHMKIHTRGNKKFECVVCQRKLSSESQLKKHLKAHEDSSLTDEKSKTFMCNICGVMLKTSGNFSVHMRKHTTNYTNICEVCDKGFFRKTDLEVHMRRNHTKEKPYGCPQCERGFVTNYDLVKHVRTHADEKPYECDYCGKNFVAKSQVANHIYTSKRCMMKRNKAKQAKLDKRPFKCPYCPLDFAKKYTLVKHQNTSACWKIIKQKIDELDRVNGELYASRKDTNEP